jgi:predicted TIM-barrel fold metal-dependent hydrolase
MTGIDTGVPFSSLEFPHDTTRTVVSLWSGGTLARCREVRFILPHAGGTVPYVATRVARLNPQLADTLSLVKRLYFDVALSTYPQVLAALTQFAGTSQVVFGTDFPFGAIGTAEATARELEALGLGTSVVDAIGRRNAVGFFPNLQTRARQHTRLAREHRRGLSSRKSSDALCQNCVRHPLKSRSNIVSYGDTLMHTIVAGSR